MRALPDLDLLKSLDVHCGSSPFACLRSTVYCLLRTAYCPWPSFHVPPVELFDIPKRVMVQNGGPEIAQATLRSHQDVRTGDADDGKARGYQFLHPIIEALAFREIQGTELFAHQAVHFRLPRSRRAALARVPYVSATARE